jgi:signal transduction histidine kinase
LILESLPQQVFYFFSHLLSTADWPPRWHCGKWSDFHGWLYIISDLCIWGAYFAIPFLILQLLIKRKDIPFHRVVGLFIAFIMLCGFTHFMDALIFWVPAYRFSALLRFFTAIVSVITVFALYRIMPLALGLRTVNDLEAEIEKRKLIEEKLASSEFLLSEAGRIGKVGGWETDILTNHTVWSAPVYDIFEIDHATPVNDLDIGSRFAEPYRSQLAEAINNAHTKGERWDLELLLTTFKNNYVWVRYIGEPLYDTNNKLRKLRGVVMNINSYKDNEIALQDNVELITRSNMQLKNFTHILSHNIRNHASNISVLLTLIDEHTLGHDNQDIVSKIVNVSNGLNTTLQDLSEAIKIRENFLQPELVDFQRITNAIIDVVAEDIKSSNATITTQYDVAGVHFPGIYMESIILNLVSNAIKYRKADEPPRLLLHTYKDESSRTVLEATDNGVGIDLNLHGEKIFGLYKTFHANKDARGVGLYLIKNQVESQKGTVTVESIPAVGTTFKITFHEEI